MQRTLIILGLILLPAGLLWPMIGKLGLGRLPGDIHVEGSSYSFYFPVMTSLLLSIVLSVVLWLANR
ncbi:DUF2905 domain-containing protein [Bradyrhizobium sp. BRP22]|uniref:DUF2905 domain-containing protein n=1 Tax=Bradyrhizobium sp. BRP22 TaxID=2793821 RepID=UPI001CD7BD34|nr:DUF2905 domain-containing protein [Bradyrhizobium sp. BRP22]MCA1455082.1 DUF2905 domain-containing protein [Bradyrhizobium sp. BRP22]